MQIEVRVQGTERLRTVLAQLGARAKPTLAGALYRQGERIMTQSKKEVPRRTGNLRASGHVRLPVMDSGGASVTLGYGGPAASYALAVHEGTGPHVITPKTAKVLAVPTRQWKGGPVHAYGSGMLPSYSKDGNFIILGKRVHHPGFQGKKYLERPALEAAATMGDRLAGELRRELEKVVR